MKNNNKKQKKKSTSYALFLPLLIFTAFLFGSVVSRAYALSDITTELSVGSTGADVTTLQTFLAEDPTIYPQGLVTGYYGTLTEAAVTAFQTKYGIDPVGSVGPITMAEINNLINNGGYGSGTPGTVTTTTGSTSSTMGKDPAIFGLSTALASSSQNLSSSTNATVDVTWQTDRNTTGEVFYSTSPLVLTESDSDTMAPTVSGTNVMTMSDNTYGTSKSIALTSLWPIDTSMTYYYMVEAVDTNGDVSVSWPRTFNSTGVSSQY